MLISAAIRAAIATIDEPAWTTIRYRNAIWDDHEQRWVSDAQIAETSYTAFAGTKHEVTARLIVRRVKRLNPKAAAGQDELFTLWRHHAFLTDSRHLLTRPSNSTAATRSSSNAWPSSSTGRWPTYPPDASPPG